MKVSIVIPSYNRANLLKRTIGSVLQQTYSNFEIIIVDDCSQDNTETVVKKIISDNEQFDIKYIKHEVNKGESGARNTGIFHSTGDYVAFLDSDDAWHNSKIEEQVEFLRKNSNKFDGVVCEYYEVYEDSLDKRIEISYPEDELLAQKVLTESSGYGVGTNFLIRRDKILELFDEELKLFSDMDWLYRILLRCRIGVLHKKLSYYYKAPMRQGDFIQHHAKIFLKKYQNIVKRLSFWEKRKLYATMNWFVAIAYEANSKYPQALYHFILGFYFKPFRRIGNYINLFKLTYKILLNKK